MTGGRDRRSVALGTAPGRWLIVVTVLVMLRTRLSPMWLVALGALAGALGWV